VASHAAICAAKVRRPVKLIYGRKEDFQSMSKRHPGWAKVAYAADKEGNIWFTANFKGYIGKLDPASGEVREYIPKSAGRIDPHTPIFDKNGVLWQTGELGRVDVGGSGTIAGIMARYGTEVVDCGTALLSMHAPWEAASKFDFYMTYKGYLAFLRDAGKKSKTA